MFSILTDQGTANSDTALCKICFPKTENQDYAREQAVNTDDIDPDGIFVVCDNDVLKCCICGSCD